jgi:hypothetical protein
MPDIDLTKLGTNIVYDRLWPDERDDTHQAPEIVQAALVALDPTLRDTPDLNNARFNVFHNERDNSWGIQQNVMTLFPMENGGQVLEDDVTKFTNAGEHHVTLSISVGPSEDPENPNGYTVVLSANHDGSYNANDDASGAAITYEVNAAGEITSRFGGSGTLDTAHTIQEQDHGRWAIAAAQGLEHRFLKFSGVGPDEAEALGRPSGASNVIPPAPAAPPARPLSEVLAATAGAPQLGEPGPQQTPLQP